ELLASLRLCANVPGQWAVQTALGGYQSVLALTSEGGRLHESRAALMDAVERSPYLSMVAPAGSLYGFVRVHGEHLGGLDDQAFALDLLEKKHILVVPGSSFYVTYR